ncbi:MAG TPA: transketolase family protein [Bacteroidetes bacterium]|nr:transketolase family protein [Bacteroidota bacterium]
MLNSDIKFNSKIFTEKIKRISPRDGFGEGLVLAGEMNERVVALCADVTESLRMHLFRDRFPERFIQTGIAEQNMAGIASGLAASGKIPVMGTYAVFSPGRNWEQIRTTICYNRQKVILIGSHAGLNVGPDGASHQALEDIALMRVLPHMAVVCPADALEARKAILAAIEYPNSVYIRLPREKSPVFTTEQTSWEIGKSQVLWFPKEGEQFSGITIFACGYLVYKALEAAKELEQEGISIAVINNSAIKPLDKETLLKWAKKSKAIITLEEHQIAGGMGSAIAEFLSENHPLPIKFMGIRDKFGQSGQAEELLKKYNLDKEAIKQTVKEILNSKFEI